MFFGQSFKDLHKNNNNNNNNNNKSDNDNDNNSIGNRMNASVIKDLGSSRKKNICGKQSELLLLLNFFP